MEVVSLFSGCGGTDLGFEKAGHQVIWANDSSINACETYEENLGLEIEPCDIRKVKSFPEAEILLGCYPCQGFSLYGTREKTDPRNFLFLEFARALSSIKPKFFLAENVKGLLFGFGKDFLIDMLKTFRKRGYDVNYKIINAKDYGVPQDRERVFIVGVRKDLHKTYNFPEPTHGPNAKPYRTLRDAIGSFSKPRKGDVSQASFSSHYMSRNRKRAWDEVSFTIQASGRQAPLHPSGAPMVFLKKDKCRFGEAPNRRLSYKECAAIQTFPKGFKFTGALDSKYKQIGNAVPPKLSKILAESLESM